MKKILLLLVLPLLVASCDTDDDTNGTTPIIDPDPSANDIKLRTVTTYGEILTDSEGKTLYFFSLDHTGESLLCDADCVKAWPIFYKDNPTLDSGLEATDFSTTTRKDGTKQTTYKGWPLYYFANDTEAGQTKGEGANDIWFVAKPDYSLMYVKAQLIGRGANSIETNLTSTYKPGDDQTFYITDDRGNTLYRFINDSNGKNNYTTSDFSNNALWPIYGDALKKVPSILSTNDFKVIDVFGRSQITYKGWPLYKFQQDMNRGDNYGVGFPQQGVWPIANNNTPIADGAEVMKDVRLLGTPKFGRVLADSQGKALYFFSWDSKGESECYGGCIDDWPVFYEEKPTLDEGLEASDFGTITRTDGTKQTTYKGWPLYYFSKDANPFEINGDGANKVWYVAKPDYSLMLASAQLIGRDVNGVETNLLEDYTPGNGRTFFITDDRGNTLYRFTPDTNGVNKYTESDFSNNDLWPIYNTDITNVPSIIKVDDFKVINVFGRSQTTYKGWPLYKFQQDMNRGDNFGVGFPNPGIWPIADQNTSEAQ